MSYKIYLDKDEVFSCEATISNSSYKNANARLILEVEDVSLVFNGKVNKNSIEIPIKGNLQKFFNEEDTGKLKLEVIVEGTTLVIPWESDVIFEKYNKVEIKEVKNVVTSKPLVEVKVESNKKLKETPSNNNKKTIVKKTNKEIFLEEFNNQLKKSKITLNKDQKKILIKRLFSQIKL